MILCNIRSIFDYYSEEHSTQWPWASPEETQSVKYYYKIP